MLHKTYDGEFIRATGETEYHDFAGKNRSEVIAMVNEMKDGDTLVINCHDN